MDKLELFKEVKKLSKRANQRLVRLEKTGVKTPAYVIANQQIETYLKRDNSRFLYNSKMSYNDLQKELRAINIFLNSQSSTVTGIKDFTKRREETFKENFGRDIKSMNNVYKFFNSRAYKKLKDLNVSSAVIVKIASEFKGDFKKLGTRINKYLKANDYNNIDYKALDEYEQMEISGGVLDDLREYIDSQNSIPTRKKRK